MLMSSNNLLNLLFLQVKSYKKGKEKAFGNLLSSASKKANGQIDMYLVKRCLEELIEKVKD